MNGSTITLNLTKIGNTFYDILTACISIADVTTDILVISNFYRKEQFTFFWIALSVVIFAQIAYAGAFVHTYVDYWDTKLKRKHFTPCETIGWFCVALLFSPIMSFIFYWTSDSDMYLAQIFRNNFGLKILLKSEDRRSYKAQIERLKLKDRDNPEKSQIKEWVEQKLRKHLGFIMEAAIELSCIVAIENTCTNRVF